MSDRTWEVPRPWKKAKPSPFAKQGQTAGVPGEHRTKREDKLVPPSNGNYHHLFGSVFDISYGTPKYHTYWPAEGWKLHISATAWRAQDVLDRVAPTLVKMGARHKFVRSLTGLEKLNGSDQVGKFITIYPQNTWQAQCILTELGLSEFPGYLKTGPRAKYDKPTGTSGILTRRYGAFTGHSIQGPEGPKGKRMPDDRTVYKPYWIDDPWETNLHATPEERWPGQWQNG